MNLGSLERVNLRTIWESEDRDFTPWLAQEDNLPILGDTIGLELELEAQEKNVGPFRADILCKNTADDSWVLIENQIERTDHKHLGQLMTYAAGLQAVTIVWVAAKFTEEHRAAIDWLNKITGEDFRFFALEVELWQINDSPAAPKFNVISQPNNWSKTVAQAAQRVANDALTEAQEIQLEYWQRLSNFIEEQSKNIKPVTPRPQHWYYLSIGKSGINLAVNLNTKNNLIKVKLLLADQKLAEQYFDAFYDVRDAIEAELGYSVEWDQKPDKKSSEIIVSKEVIPNDKDDWNNQHSWILERLEEFDRVFRPRIKNFTD